jgi:NAD(P)-dependent dehydrogenase (short-subunit alcohol dehydrogenase family)
MSTDVSAVPVALVTGASSGIGRALARQFVENVTAVRADLATPRASPSCTPPPPSPP